MSPALPERLALVEAGVEQLSERLVEARAAIDEGRAIVLPLQATVAAQGAALLRLERDIREDLGQIRAILERRATSDRPLYSLGRAAIAPIAAICRVVAENERGQLRWIVLAFVAIAAIVWGVPVALDWGGVAVGVADTDAP